MPGGEWVSSFQHVLWSKPSRPFGSAEIPCVGPHFQWLQKLNLGILGARKGVMAAQGRPVSDGPNPAPVDQLDETRVDYRGKPRQSQLQLAQFLDEVLGLDPLA